MIMLRKLQLLLLLALLTPLPFVRGQKSPDAVSVLLDFENTLHNWTDTSAWRWSADTEPCAQNGKSWPYVMCSSDHQVAGLNFSHVNLRGAMPQDSWGELLSQVDTLVALDFRNASLVLDLSSSQFEAYRTTGSSNLPASWGQSFPKLVELHAPQLGSLPAEWGARGAFPSLEIWEVLGQPGYVDDQLGGSLPGSWGVDGGLQSLRELLLGSNGLTGTLSPQLAQLPNLTVLDLHDNNFWEACRLDGPNQT
ncbi:hypothetical protein WJX73_010780 [Symbiochloris irregularis]|uniref:Uncharacterized protein n=1 Tax=Symbiochloris irregularis TaxID=706552 RepID=A0AAW1NQS5_9CHLO